MSWHYSRALVEAYWGERSLDGEPCAQSKSTSIAGTCWSPGKTTDALSRSLSGMTYEPLTDDRGEDVLTWCLEGSLVRTSPAQERGQDLTASGPVFGGKCGEPLAKLCPVTSLLKTPQCLLFGEEQESLQTLPKWGSIVDGELSEHTIPALLTSGTGCGSWVPTPMASEGAAGTPDGEMQWMLTHAIKSGFPNRAQYKESKDGNAKNAGCQLWTGADITTESGNAMTVENGHTPFNLSSKKVVNYADLRMFPTPTSRDWKDGPGMSLEGKNPDGSVRKRDDLLPRRLFAQGNTGGQLNPDWVEWLMGWIIGMTSTEPLNPDRFRAWQRAFIPGLEDSRQSETDKSQPAQH